MPGDWTSLTEAFVLGAFPWVSQLRKLHIHFTPKGTDVAAPFNFFASLFAVGVYGYVSYSHPTQVIDLPRWSTFLAVAAVLTALFMANFLWMREPVTQGTHTWPVMASFVIYLCIFSSLTAGFGALRVLQEFVVIEGRVVEAPSQTAVASADVEVRDLSGEYRRNAKSDAAGRFVILVEQANVATLDKALITRTGYQERQITFSGGFSAVLSLRHVELFPN